MTSDTSQRPDRRQQLLEAAGQYVLSNGLSDLSLRPLAAAIGTSDRMLLYYFGTKDQLVAAVLDTLSAGLMQGLTSALPHSVVTPPVMYTALVNALTQEPMRPVMRLWFDVAAQAVRGVEPYAAAAGAVLRTWTGWAAERLDTDADTAAVAHALVAAIEGRVLLSLLSDADASEADEWMHARLAIDLAGKLNAPAAPTGQVGPRPNRRGTARGASPCRHGALRPISAPQLMTRATASGGLVQGSMSRDRARSSRWTTCSTIRVAR